MNLFLSYFCLKKNRSLRGKQYGYELLKEYTDELVFYNDQLDIYICAVSRWGGQLGTMSSLTPRSLKCWR